ncbi:DUF1284 domain-containing protein [Rhizobium paknamense]|uniref:DUF1284 domain-containing protein n=1 Tax=Rhizobium paknamense TaxID=1206817 RepID=A0ABU0IA58_9HYPH|nr:DUF1284 domain-containing protein [Rhizobium paknamense]MDQ0455115.1 hypothetical protein [Rhizobium paknamense]
MTVRLRAHHLLCMLTFVGEGYSPAFIANYRRIAERLTGGEEIEMVEGPDDLCRPLCDSAEAHCFRESVCERDAAAALAVSALLGRSVEAGVRFLPDAATITRLRQAFVAGSIRAACRECEWAYLCDDIAGKGYRGALVHPC